jgi:hypothetical protein
MLQCIHRIWEIGLGQILCVESMGGKGVRIRGDVE